MCGIDVDAEGNDWDDEMAGDRRDSGTGGGDAAGGASGKGKDKGKGKATEKNKSPHKLKNVGVPLSPLFLPTSRPFPAVTLS